MLLVEPLFDLSHATHLVFRTGELCTTITYVMKSPENDLEGNKIVSIKVRTNSLPTLLSKLEVAESCMVFLQGTCCEGTCVKEEIRNNFKSMIEVEEPTAGALMESLKFLDENLGDTCVSVPGTKPSWDFPSLRDVSYPYLVLSISSTPVFIKVLSPEKAEYLKQNQDSVIDSSGVLKTVKNEDFLDLICSLEREKRNAVQENGPIIKDSQNKQNNPVLRWLSSLGEAISQQVTNHDIKQVVVTDCGYGLTEAVMESLSEAVPVIQLWFVRHEGVAASLATLLSKSYISETSWFEDVYNCSGLLLEGRQIAEKGMLGQHVLQDAGTRLRPCPLLRQRPSPHETNDLIEESALNIVMKVIRGTRVNILNAYPNQDLSKMDKLIQKTKDFIDYLAENPRACGKCSVHKYTYIFTRFGLKETFDMVKAEETDGSLRLLEGRLREMDGLEERQRAVEAVRGCVAGNIFDWGSSVLEEYTSGDRRIDFTATLDKLPKRPWTMDQADDWAEALIGKGFKKAVIFVDNAGVDFILGIIPLARELLKRGSKVVISGTRRPVLNDVTSEELPGWLARVADVCSIVRRALQSGMLTHACNGQSKPSLDLQRLGPESCEACVGADLVVVQGMARAAVSNLYLSLACPVLKMFNIKEKALSTLLNTPPLDGLCLFTPPFSSPSL